MTQQLKKISDKDRAKARINLMAKSGLARMMAFENLAVIHSPAAKTASFDLVNRVVTLPVLKEMTGYMYDAFIAHEIAHALYTPSDKNMWKKLMSEVPHMFINVTEDARIEKLIKRRYPGTKRDFYLFYKELVQPERDFFGLQKLPKNPLTGKPVKPSELSLIDKINLHFKIGTEIKISFTAEEMTFVKQVGDAETFEEAVQAAKDIYDWMKKNGQAIEVKIQIGQLKQGESQDENEQSGSGSTMVVSKQQQQSDDDGEEGDDSSSESSDDEKDGKQKKSSKKKDADKDKSKKDKAKGNSKDEGDEDEQSGSGKDDDSTSAENEDDGENEASGSDGSDGDGEENDDETDGQDGGSSGDAGEDETDDGSDSDQSANAQANGEDDSVTVKSGITQQNFDDAVKQLIDEKAAQEGVSFGDVYNATDEYNRNMKPVSELIERLNKGRLPVSAIEADNEFGDFLKEITPTINMMVAQFNMKKSAQEYQRMQIAKSGALDMDDISMYQVKDDLFKRNELIPESKNHGMVMLIDWSGSMTNYIHSTLKQLCILMEFCRKVQIPFEVYGFTNPDSYGSYYRHSASYGGVPANKIFATKGTELFQMFTSAMSTKDFRHVASIALKLCKEGNAETIHSMGGTPLKHSAFMMEYAIKQFKEKYKCEKTIFVLLSDGDPTDAVVEGSSSAKENIIMRNSETGKNYEFKNSSIVYHDIFQYVKEACNVTKMCGFFLTSAYHGAYTQKLCPKPKRPADLHRVNFASDFNSKKFTQLPSGNAFDQYFVISINNFQIDTTDYLSATTNHTSANARKSALAKELTKGINSMIFMKWFIDEVS